MTGSAPIRDSDDALLAEPLQQVDRTMVLYRGRKLSYFAGCDYYRLSSHPEVLRALQEAVERVGLNVAASRKTTGNHSLFALLESRLAEFFDVEAAVLVSNGYMTNLAVGQALAGQFDRAIIDERSHGCLFDAAKLLSCPVYSFKHLDPESALATLRRHGGGRRILLLTDGLFSHTGQIAPVNAYLRTLPRSTTILLDDAHSAGVLGERGRGTAEHLGVASDRIIRTITLSKAFGVYGGAVLGSRSVRRRIIEHSRLFVGNTPLPLPLVAAALKATELVRNDKTLRRRLLANIQQVRSALGAANISLPSGPGPIIPIHPANSVQAKRLKAALLKAEIYPPYINYLGGPRDAYFRFALSSEHTEEQVSSLIRVLVTQLKP